MQLRPRRRVPKKKGRQAATKKKLAAVRLCAAHLVSDTMSTRAGTDGQGVRYTDAGHVQVRYTAALKQTYMEHYKLDYKQFRQNVDYWVMQMMAEGDLPDLGLAPLVKVVQSPSGKQRFTPTTTGPTTRASSGPPSGQRHAPPVARTSLLALARRLLACLLLLCSHLRTSWQTTMGTTMGTAMGTSPTRPSMIP